MLAMGATVVSIIGYVTRVQTFRSPPYHLGTGTPIPPTTMNPPCEHENLAS